MVVNVENVKGFTSDAYDMDSSAEAITGRVRALRMRAGFTLAELATRMGKRGASSVQRYENPNEYAGGYLKRDLVAELERALIGRGTPPIVRSEVWELAGPEFAPSPTPPPNAIIGDTLTGGFERIPLYGQAVAGADGEFALNGNHLDNITAPPVLSGVSGAYAVAVSGSSMEPRYFDGEVVYVHPRKRPVRGDFVVAQIRNPKDEDCPLAYVKRFVRWNEGTGLTVEQYNPAKELHFAHADVVSVHVVVMGGLST